LFAAHVSSDFQGPGCGGNTPSLCTAALDRRRGGHGRDAQFPAEFMVCCFFVHLSVFCFFVGDLQFFFSPPFANSFTVCFFGSLFLRVKDMFASKSKREWEEGGKLDGVEDLQ
jgi:hypothetical protein